MAEDAEQESFNFAQSLGLDADATAWVQGLPVDVREKVVRCFDPSGTKDGNVFGRLQGFAKGIMQPGQRSQADSIPTYTQRTWSDADYAPAAFDRQAKTFNMASGSSHIAPSEYIASMGLDERTAALLAELPAQVTEVVVNEFNAQGTKDGNVFGRLLGFVRGVWAKQLQLDRPTTHCVSAYLRELPEEVQATVLAQFDANSSKDGRIMARLESFTNGILAKQTKSFASADRSGRAYEHFYRGPANGFGSGDNWWQQGHEGGHGMYAAVPQSQGRAGNPSPFDDFACQLALDETAVQFLRTLTEDILATVIQEFRPGGSKDGNVWGRLFGFVRSVWAQRLYLDNETISYMRGLPEEAQVVVISKFDPSTTKDGNVAARLRSFANSLASTPTQGGRSQSRWQSGGVDCLGGFNPPHNTWCPPESQKEVTIEEFVRRWGLTTNQTVWLKSLPEEVGSTVVSSFTSKGTKDGNVWGRLFGFVRSVWFQRQGIDVSTAAHIKSLTEDAQMVIMANLDLSQSSDPMEEIQRVLVESPWISQIDDTNAVDSQSQADANAALAKSDSTFETWDVSRQRGDRTDQSQQSVELAVVSFVEQHGFDPESAIDFLLCLATDVRDAVLRDFNPGPSKDGNLMARLEGFARSVQARGGRPRHNSVDPAVSSFVAHHGFEPGTTVAFLQSLASDVREAVIQDFSPGASKDGNLMGRLEGFARSVQARAGRPRQQSVDPVVLSFVVQHGLEVGSGAAFLQSLAPDVREAVIQDFSPGASKDGNLMGRLEGFARSVQARRVMATTWDRPRHQSVDPAVSSFVSRHGLEPGTAVAFLQSLTPDVKDAVILDFSPGASKDGNLMGRLEGFARSVQARRGQGRGADSKWDVRNVRQRTSFGWF